MFADVRFEIKRAILGGERPLESGTVRLGGGIRWDSGGRDTNAQPYSTQPGHPPRWVSLWCGFHRNVHATAVVSRGDFGPNALGYASLGVPQRCRDATRGHVSASRLARTLSGSLGRSAMGPARHRPWENGLA